MKQRRFFLGAVLLLILIYPAVTHSEEFSDLLVQGDRLFSKRTDMNKARQAADKYRQAFKLEPGNEKCALKLAGALYWIGINLPVGPDVEVYEEAMEAAKKAVEISPESAESHYLYGVTMGLYAQAKGVVHSLAYIEPIKKEMAEVIRISPCFKSGAAYRTLGRVYFSLPGALGGSNEKAMSYYRKALKCCSTSWLTHLWIADLLKDEGNVEEAKELVQMAIDAPCDKADWPECQKVWKKEAKKELKKLEETVSN